jgi:protein-L-isoaspartate(D-aspartate) O-methyltransferase
MEKLYDIFHSIYNTTNTKYRNFSKLSNINCIINNEISNDIQKIINEKEIKNKFEKILKLSWKNTIKIKNKDNNKDEMEKSSKIIKKFHDIRPIHNTLKELCNELVQKQWITSQKVYDVMMQVDRKDFAPTNPYENNPQRIGCNVVISAPLLHAYCLEALKDYLKPGCKALDVGSGSGYLTVAMSKMMNDKGLVVGIEHMEELYKFGKENISKNHKNLLDTNKIKLIKGDGRLGYKEEAPYDCIHVGAFSLQPPEELKKQLKVGGRLVMPLYNKDGNQYIYIMDKKSEGFESQQGLSVCYVPLTDPKSQLYGSN